MIDVIAPLVNSAEILCSATNFPNTLPTPLVRSNVADVLASSLQVSGNRVRGLNAADLEMDDFFSINRIPFDSYNSQSLEIDRWGRRTVRALNDEGMDETIFTDEVARPGETYLMYPLSNPLRVDPILVHAGDVIWKD